MKAIILKSHYLFRHQSYIDRRIDTLEELISSRTDESSITGDIINAVMTGHSQLSELSGESSSAISDLNKLSKEWDIAEDGDLFGYIYQRLESRSSRKKKGQYFTPAAIVDYLVSKSITDGADLDSIKILDPACGSGQFLISAYKHLQEIYQSRGLSPEEAAERILRYNLFGIDIDPVAVSICTHNLKRLAGMDQVTPHIISEDYLFNRDGSSPFPKSFHIIIGNPPWGSSMTAEQKKSAREHYYSASSGINSFTMFIERSLEALEENGTMSFLIPEAYLNIKAHQNSRKLVLDNSCIKEISVWGELFKNVFAPSMSLSLQKCSDNEKRESNIIHVRTKNNFSSGTTTLIPQNYYQKTIQNIFNILYTHRAENIVTKIRESGTLTLNDNAEFFLGVVTGSNSLHLSNQQSETHPDPIITSKDVDKYRISFGGNYFCYNPSALQQTASRECYTSKQKIVYRFIGRNLTFAVDDIGYYSLNNVNGFIPYLSNCTPEYIAALLNSQVIQYFYDKSFFTYKVLKGNIGQIPLKIPCTEDMHRITRLAREASNTTNSFEYASCKDRINDFFFSLYGITDKEANRILLGGYNEDPDQDVLF
jgi:predicted RNA methylase